MWVYQCAAGMNVTSRRKSETDLHTSDLVSTHPASKCATLYCLPMASSVAVILFTTIRMLEAGTFCDTVNDAA